MIAESMINNISPTNNNINKKNTKSTRIAGQDSIPSFIRKTFDILEENKFPNIISWNAEGTALVISKPLDFCQTVLPNYFKHKNLTSFVRQLNMYNFHKRRTQNMDHIYAHELFQRNKRYLLKDIRRKTADHNNASSPASEEAIVKLPETFYAAPSAQDKDALLYENQFLKKLYNEVMSKLMALETQTEELTTQNQNLIAQLQEQNSQNLKTKETNAGQNVLIPSLKLNIERPRPTNNFDSLSIAKLTSKKVSSYLNLDDSTEFNESPFTAPSTQINEEKAESIDNRGHPLYFNLGIQKLRSDNDLRISKENMSIGHLLEAWNVDVMGDNSTSLLGKRELSISGMDFVDLSLKRRELSIFGKKGLSFGLSNGIHPMTEDFDMDLFTFIN